MTAILAMPHFQKVFGAGANLNTSVIFSIYTVGGIAGSPFSAWIADRFGRRASMAIGAVIIIVGAILAAAAHNFGALVGGRFILGMGISVMTVAAPAYAIEIAPPQWRGRVTGFYNCGWFGGSIPAAAITYGCNQIDSDWQFRIPLALQCFACVVVLTSVWWIPESPRYLMMRGKEDEAREYLIKYHGNGDPDNGLVHLELMEMREGIRQDGIDKRWWDYRGLFNTHNARWRFGTVIMFLTFCTFSTGGLGYYNTLIYGLLDITSPSRQLVFNLVSSIISAAGALGGTSLTDKMPRRKVLISGTALLAGLLATNAALSDKIADQLKAGQTVTQGYAKGGLAANLLNGLFFSFCFTPLQTVIPAECMETTMRAKGLALSGAWLSALSFINLFAAPIALGKMGSNYMYVWVGCGIVETFIYYFRFVECQGRTLEELDWIFNQPHPVSASKKKEKVVVQEDRVVAEYVEDGDRV